MALVRWQQQQVSRSLAQRHAELELKRSEAQRLDAELARAQLAEGLAGGDGGREKARARVNRLMREVDKCIALLRQPETGAEERQATK